MGEFRDAFADSHSTIEDQIGEGDRVVTRWRMRGEFRGIGIFRFSDEGRVVESWDSFDRLGMMRQLGAIPAPEHSEETGPT